MKAPFYNKLNSISLILIGLWGYLDYADVQSPTALIPVGFGVILFLCNNGLNKENKVISHIAVLLTLVILFSLVGMRLPKSVDAGGLGLLRVCAMIITSVLSMVAFILSFIKARK
tara:strand:- start:25 stop:369 length:345 start_codon:yes stop_codon:yes gene_type:complete